MVIPQGPCSYIVSTWGPEGFHIGTLGPKYILSNYMDRLVMRLEGNSFLKDASMLLLRKLQLTWLAACRVVTPGNAAELCCRKDWAFFYNFILLTSFCRPPSVLDSLVIDCRNRIWARAAQVYTYIYIYCAYC